MATLLDVQSLQTQFSTRGGVVRAVDGVSWDVQEGETVALVAESGCGKSVSALSVMRLVAAPAGRILFKGRDLLTLSEEEMRRVRGRARVDRHDRLAAARGPAPRRARHCRGRARQSGVGDGRCGYVTVIPRGRLKA